MHQQRQASFLATATIAAWCPLRARMRSKKACIGPGAKITDQEASTSA
jgi:hypothetical protein